MADSDHSLRSQRSGRPDKRWVGRSFSLAAERYDGLAGLQRAVAERLLSRWQDGGEPPELILDVGAGTGYPTRRLMELFPAAEIIALDLAEGMLRVARARCGRSGKTRLVCGDAERLPLAADSVGLIFSNLAIQWCSSSKETFREFKRVLKPGGQVLFSTFGGETLAELRRAWAVADGYSHVMSFGDLQQVKNDLHEAGFSSFDLEVECSSLEYAGVYDLMRELKGLGAHNVTLDRPRHLVGKGALNKMVSAYEPRTERGGIRASFEIICGWIREGGIAR
jgi:malonyl-CoA O-methyltransferase